MLMRRLILRGVCSVESEGGGDGGGGGAGGGAGGDGKSGGTPALTDEVKTFIGQSINAALTSHSKRAETRTADLIKSTLDAALEKFKPKDDAGGGGGGGGGAGGGAGGNDDMPASVKQALAKIQSENEALKRQNAEERRLREENESKGRKNEERAELSSALAEGGIPAHVLPPLAAYLHTETGRIVRDEHGAVCLTMKRDWGEEKVPIKAGIAEWLKTDEGKKYLPAVAAGGSGNRGGSAPGGARKPGEKMGQGEAMDIIGQALLSGQLFK